MIMIIKRCGKIGYEASYVKLP